MSTYYDLEVDVASRLKEPSDEKKVFLKGLF